MTSVLPAVTCSAQATMLTGLAHTVVVSMRNVAVVAPAGTVTVLDAGRA